MTFDCASGTAPIKAVGVTVVTGLTSCHHDAVSTLWVALLVDVVDVVTSSGVTCGALGTIQLSAVLTAHH